MNELALFAGIGGGILGTQLLGHTTVCAVEFAKYPREVLLQRQLDGLLPRFPIWDDVCTFDGVPWRGKIDVVSGGFPCQDISTANPNAKGIRGARSGLWQHYARIVDEVRPRYVFAENSPALCTRGLEYVLSDLTAIGYATTWAVLSSRATGGEQVRARLWIVAKSTFPGHDLHQSDVQVRDAAQARVRKRVAAHAAAARRGELRASCVDQSLVVRSRDAFPRRLERARAIGNAQDPVLAAVAFDLLKRRIDALVE